MRRSTPPFGLTAALFLIAPACGGGGSSDPDPSSEGQVSCDTNGAGMHILCEETATSNRQAFQQACQQKAGQADVTFTYAEGPCSRVDALGGCTTKSGGYPVTNWSYKTEGVEVTIDIQARCTKGGGTYVKP